MAAELVCDPADPSPVVVAVADSLNRGGVTLLLLDRAGNHWERLLEALAAKTGRKRLDIHLDEVTGADRDYGRARLVRLLRRSPDALFVFFATETLFGPDAPADPARRRARKQAAAAVISGLARVTGVAGFQVRAAGGLDAKLVAASDINVRLVDPGPTDTPRVPERPRPADPPVPRDKAAGADPLPNCNFSILVDGKDIGLCAVSAPSSVGGFLSGEGFDPADRSTPPADVPTEELRQWPTVTLRRGVTTSKALYRWRMNIVAGKSDLRQVEIQQLDLGGERVVNTWVLADCWPKRWTGPSFDALSRGVGYEEVELYFRTVLWR